MNFKQNCEILYDDQVESLLGFLVTLYNKVLLVHIKLTTLLNMNCSSSAFIHLC